MWIKVDFKSKYAQLRCFLLGVIEKINAIILYYRTEDDSG